MKAYGLNNTPFFTLKGKECYCRVVDMYDADTLTLVVPLFDGYYKFACRVYGIDTAEIKSATAELKQLAQKAKNRMLQLCGVSAVELEDSYNRKEVQELLNAEVCVVWCKFDDFDKYGRPLVTVYEKEHGRELAECLVEEGLAKSYFGGTKTY